ncbi:MAG: hypothetical protein ACMUIS_03630 [bacterium]
MKRLVRETVNSGIVIIILVLVVPLAVSPGNAYFGTFSSGFYGGLGSYGLGGLYGMGLYGLGGMYGGSYGLYGLSGLGGLYGLGGIYGLGGLYGMGLYGLGGMYGGSYGLYGLSGLGGLYGLGLGGLCGLSGLYGLSGLSGLGGLGGLYGLGGLSGLGGLLGSMGLLGNLGLGNTITQSTPTQTAVLTAEQAGTWSGTWTSLVTLKGGFMDMSLVEDVLTGVLSGQVNLFLNKVTNSIPADVTGYLTTVGPGSLGITGTGGAVATFILSGGNQSFFSSLVLVPVFTSAIPLYTINLVCVMTSPVTMTGTYDVQDIYKLNADSGEFQLTLTAPVI